MNIAVITPVKHLAGVPELIESKGNTFYLEKSTKQEVKELPRKKNWLSLFDASTLKFLKH